MNDIQIVFFGTGPVAAKSLELLAKNFNIEAVITKPKPRHHRGEFPVMSVAEKLDLPVLPVINAATVSEVMQSSNFSSQVGVLIDFGIIVRRDVIDSFKRGIVNSHFSVLPQWRGADPISFAILSGQKVTGVSLMAINEKMDEGDIIAYKEQPLDGSETNPSLTQKLIQLSDLLIKSQLRQYIKTGKTTDQSITGRDVSYSKKIEKSDGIIDWSKPAEQIEREIRAFTEWPKSRTTLGSVEVILTKAHAVPTNHTENEPGDITIISEANTVMVECGTGSLCIEELKPAGKNTMTAKSFLAGYRQKLE